MKKLLLLVSALTLCIFGAAAQNNDDETELLIESQQGDVVLKIAGYSITFGGNDQAEPEIERPRRHSSQFGQVYDSGMPFFELGASLLSTPDYSLYTTADGDFMTLGAKSCRVTFNTLTASLAISPRGNLRIATAISVLWDNYVFANALTLERQNGLVKPVALSKDVKKSKLTTSSIRIPVVAELYLGGKLYLSGGVYGEWTQGWTKYKEPKTRNDNVNGALSALRWGYIARLGIDDFVISFDYCQTPLFAEGCGPKTFPYSLGVGLAF